MHCTALRPSEAAGLRRTTGPRVGPLNCVCVLCCVCVCVRACMRVRACVCLCGWCVCRRHVVSAPCVLDASACAVYYVVYAL